MIRVNVLYANDPGSTFDMDYYLTKHIPMVQAKLGAALKGVTVDHALSGGKPGTEAGHRVIATLMFDSVEAYERAFGPVGVEIRADVARYTNIVPATQVSEVKL